MVKRKATGAGAGRRTKRTKTTTAGAFLWKANDWKVKRAITQEVSLLVSGTNSKQFLVKKVLDIDEDDDAQPPEIRALARLPDCNRIVKPIAYSHADPDPEHGTALFEHYLLGDLQQWRQKLFVHKNRKPVPESFIWRCFLQINLRGCMTHRDIKPKNILVAENGTTYPSFKLHDFDCAMTWEKSTARQPARCGTFQWQPPEGPRIGINTKAAELWALGAFIYFLATGQPPIEDSDAYAAARLRDNNNQHPDSAREYGRYHRYYDAHVPRRFTPINLSSDELHQQGLGLSTEEKRARGMGPEYHQYSDELNDWMAQCLSQTPSRRPTAERLVYGMSLAARGMLKKMGGKAALVDLEAKFGADA
ncbi:kinase-like protein [Decorospora gaudefroyi]|uniref:Kinase-like protein n=1 Tax=Decorospora gaudefroyi TaxID=184978 RepID=A0A6A5KW84_9PLEO|nr:kinase-like protein [Decorospora gaudefroyi]